MNPFDAVRTSCRAVADQAQHVTLNGDTIDAYARDLAGAKAVHALDNEFHHRGADDVETATYVVVLDAVNFGSGWFPLLEKSGMSSGYFKIATSLRDWFASGVPTAAELSQVTGDECARIFGQQNNVAVADLMALFAQSLNDLGRHVDGACAGSFAGLIEAADGQAARLVEILATMPLYRDVATFRGANVSLYKRAQITASDLSLALSGRGLGHFDDIDSLTCFADNVVPHVLRCDGVLSYDDALAARIERGELIEPGSGEEVEIRACAVTAVEMLSVALAEQGRPTPARILDTILWDRGRAPEYKSRQRHRARSPYY